MKERSIAEWMSEVVAEDIQHLTRSIGPGVSEMDSVAYDTAWVSRLVSWYSDYPFEESLNWLRRHQHADGSWGSPVLHYHDRMISTLAAITALKKVGRGYADLQRIEHGETYLWCEHARLAHDANDTIGYPLLAYTLTNEAIDLGLDVPHTLLGNRQKIERKMALLGNQPKLWRFTTLAISLEAAGQYIPVTPDFVEANGSVGTSPAATAAFLLHSESGDPRALDYLSQVIQKQGDGGAPFCVPIDIFEILWSLNNLRIAGAITPNDPEVRRVLDFVWSRWVPEKGITYSPYFHVQDLDDTAVGFALLKWAGYPVQADVFTPYEQDNYFVCYPGELDQSLSANIRTLAALRWDQTHPLYESRVEKIRTLMTQHDQTGHFWFDKWHVSPYYLTCTAIWSALGVMDETLPPRIEWILKTQRADGGWGYYHASTVEETAYCLQALLYWDRHSNQRIEPAAIRAAALYVAEHYNDDFVSLWIGKSLYTPRKVVRSAVLAALNSYCQYETQAVKSFAIQSERSSATRQPQTWRMDSEAVREPVLVRRNNHNGHQKPR